MAEPWGVGIVLWEMVVVLWGVKVVWGMVVIVLWGMVVMALGGMGTAVLVLALLLRDGSMAVVLLPYDRMAWAVPLAAPPLASPQTTAARCAFSPSQPAAAAAAAPRRALSSGEGPARSSTWPWRRRGDPWGRASWWKA